MDNYEQDLQTFSDPLSQSFTPKSIPQDQFPLTEDQRATINNASQGISLIEPKAEEQSISLIDDGTPPLPPANIARAKAIKAAHGTGGDVDTLNTQIASGREGQARDKAAFDADINWQKQKNRLIKGIVQENGGNLPDRHMETLLSMSREDWSHDPQTIFEKKLAQKVVRDTIAENVAQAPTGMWGQLWKANPKAATQSMKQQSDLLTKVDIVNDVNQEAEEELKNRGIVQNTLSILGGITPGIQYANMISTLKEAPWDYASLPGTIKKEQLSYLWSIRDPSEFKLKVKETYEALKSNNFMQAKEFIGSMKGYSSVDQFMLSSTGVLDLTFLPVGRAAKGVVSAVDRSVKNLQGTMKGAEAVDEGPFKFVGGAIGTGKTKFTELPPIPEVVQDAYRQGRFEPVQLDLFRGDPRQSDLFPSLRAGEAQTPPSTAGLPPGRLRSTYKPIAEQEAEGYAKSMLPGRSLGTGRFEPGQGAYVQGELPLTGGQGQRSFDFTTPTGKQVLQDGIDRQIAFAGYSKHATRVSDNLVGNSSLTTADITSDAAKGLYGMMERNTPAWKDAPIRPVDMTPAYVNTRDFFGQNSLYNKAAAAAQTRTAEFEKRLDEALRVRRISEAAEGRAAISVGERQKADGYARFGADGVIDAVHLPSSLFKSNTAQSVLRLGDPETKAPFLSRAQAELAAKDRYKLAADEYQIYIGQKNDFYIGLRANVTENTNRTLNFIYEAREARDLGFIPYIKSRGAILDSWISGPEMAQRKVATHSQQGLKELVNSQGAFWKTISPSEVKQVNLTLTDFGKERRWFTTVEDFEKKFAERHAVPPTTKQVEAAYLYKQIQDYDLMIRNAGQFRDLARQGAESITLIPKVGKAEPFNGIIKEDGLPWSHGDEFTVALYKSGEDAATVGHSFQMQNGQSKMSKAEIDDLIANKGYRVIQIVDGSERPLAKMGLTDGFVQYVVTDAVHVKPLHWQQVKYEPGPHSIYPQDWYVKQAKIAQGHLGKDYYYGDNTLWMFSSKAEASMWFERLETARQKVMSKSPDAEAYITTNLPYNSLKEFNTLRDHFNLDHPFSLTRRGYSAFETQEELAKVHPNVINFHKSSHNPLNFMDRAFLQERDALVNVPAEHAGKMEFVKAQQLDALDSLDMGLNQSIRGMWLNDEKVRTVTQWVENYKDVLDMSADKARAIPMWALHNGNLKKIAPGDALYPKLVAAEQEKQALLNFVGQQSDWGLEVGNLQTKVMDSIFKTGGRDWADWANPMSLSFIRDPARYFRATVANAALGFFNPIPMLQQAMTHINVMSIVPEHAWRATTATWLLRATEHTAEEAVLNRAAEMATKFGWRKEYFKEMNQGYRSSGMDVVGKEATLRNDLADSHLFNNSLGHIWADKGFMFWNAGERFTRKSSYAAGYMEWRTANPTAKFTEEAQASVVQRASQLTGHMNAASLSNWENNAAASVTLQFTSWYSHMAQLMMGKELTTAEKVRLVGVNSLLFGVPAGLGIGGLPGAVASGATSALKVEGDQRSLTGAAIMTAAGALGFGTPYDDIREYLRGKGWDDKISGMVPQALMKGIPNMLFQFYTGKDPDFAKNYASGANGFIRDELRKDKGFFGVLIGASGSTMKGIIESVEPILYKTMVGASVESHDFLRVASNVRTLDYAQRVALAFAYGKYQTQSGLEIRGLDQMDAVLTALRLSPKQYQDSMINFGTRADLVGNQKDYEDLALKSLRRAIQARKDGDEAKAGIHDRDAMVYLKAGDFNTTKSYQIRTRAAQEAFGVETTSKRSLDRSLSATEQAKRQLPQHFRNEP